MIVTTGASGAVGGMVAAELARRGLEQRLITRDPGRAPDLPGAEVVVAEYGDPDSLRRALHPGDAVFMVSLHQGPATRVPLHRAFIEAAAERGVARIVYLSFVNAGRDAVFLHAHSHGATEAMLMECGVPYVAVRNSMYADDIPSWFDAQRVDRSPCGDGRMSFSDRSDLARAIAVSLTEPQHPGEIYNITTPESVTQSELAEIASRVTGRPFTYQPTNDAWWEQRWKIRGKEEWAIEAGLTSFAAIRAGEFDVVSDDYRQLTGSDPLTIEQIIAREMP